MKDNERLIAALNKAIEIHPEVEIGKFINYISAVEDLSYMEDSDLAIQIEDYNHLANKYKNHFCYNIKPNDKHYIDQLLYIDNCTFYDFTKENEQIAYERYKAVTKDKVFIDFAKEINMKNFLEKFELEIVEADDYADITIINHKDSFLNIFPLAYRHMNGYVVARKNDKYIAKHVYLVKIPCFGKLMHYVMQE